MEKKRKEMKAMANFLTKAYQDTRLKSEIRFVYEREGAFALALLPTEEGLGYLAEVLSTEEELGDYDLVFEVYPDGGGDQVLLEALSEVAYAFASRYLWLIDS